MPERFENQQAFNDNVTAWKDELRQPWMHLRYSLERTYIRQHVGDGPLHILDAGGGNGRHAISFAQQGHSVALVDFSAEMLADARDAAEQAGVSDRIEFHHADVADIPDLFPDTTFDLVLCHNIVQYVDDVPATLRAIGTPLHDGGVLSLVTVNSHSEVYKSAIRNLDLEQAHAHLHGAPTEATLFGTPMRRFTEEDLRSALADAGFTPLERYGVRCLCDWLPNEPKFEPAFMQHLERLERELATEYPYYLLARYWQIIATKAAYV